MTATRSREIHLRRRPVGLPSEDDFALVEVTLPEPAAGEVLVRNHYLSVDPYMRGRMYDRPSYVPPFQVGQVLEGGCVGQVVASRGNAAFQEGDYVSSRSGWRECYISDGSDLTRVEPKGVPLQAFLGTMGMPGLTAYVGLLDMGKPREGETVFVSGAAGAVGMVVCQIARIKGCRVVGSAGSAAKVQWLRDVAGVDAALNYKDVSSLVDEVGRLCPERHRRVFRERRRRPSGSGAGTHEPLRPSRPVRHDLAVQRGCARSRQPDPRGSQAADAAGLHRFGPCRPPGAVPRRHDVLDRGRQAQMGRDHRRRPGKHPKGVHRAVHGATTPARCSSGWRTASVRVADLRR